MLKHTNHKDRALFLKLFTQELINNSKLKIAIEKKPEIEKPTMAKPIKTEEFVPSILTQAKIETIEPALITKPQTEEIPLAKEITPIKSIKHIRPLAPAKPLAKPQLITPAPLSPPEIKPQPSTTPHPSTIPHPPTTLPPPASLQAPSKTEGEIDLGKINIFLEDKAITMIECPGPDKFILVKKASQVNITKTTLSQEKIDEIIKNFSEKARIPIIGGVFKASIRDLTITAVVSEFVGSKFIIYKTGPYSILEQQTQQLQQAQVQAKLQKKRLF